MHANTHLARLFIVTILFFLFLFPFELLLFLLLLLLLLLQILILILLLLLLLLDRQFALLLSIQCAVCYTKNILLCICRAERL